MIEFLALATSTFVLMTLLSALLNLIFPNTRRRFRQEMKRDVRFALPVSILYALFATLTGEYLLSALAAAFIGIAFREAHENIGLARELKQVRADRDYLSQGIQDVTETLRSGLYDQDAQK